MGSYTGVLINWAQMNYISTTFKIFETFSTFYYNELLIMIYIATQLRFFAPEHGFKQILKKTKMK